MMYWYFSSMQSVIIIRMGAIVCAAVASTYTANRSNTHRLAKQQHVTNDTVLN